MNEKKNKKALVALLIVAIVGVIGFTFAYFSDKITVNNEFKTKPYGTTVTEVFVSPENWTPGTETEKTVVTKNSGEVDEAVRVSYTEKWVSANGDELSGSIQIGGSSQPVTPSPDVPDSDDDISIDDDVDIPSTPSVTYERAAIINFDNESDWTVDYDENGKGYYYYNKKLAKGESTSSFIKSVTFNGNVESSSDCPKTVTGGTQTITCTSTGNGYDGATYTLTITVETVQYDQYKAAWGTNVVITDPSATQQQP